MEVKVHKHCSLSNQMRRVTSYITPSLCRQRKKLWCPYNRVDSSISAESLQPSQKFWEDLKWCLSGGFLCEFQRKILEVLKKLLTYIYFDFSQYFWGNWALRLLLMSRPCQTTWGLDSLHGCSEGGGEDNNSCSCLEMKPGVPARSAHLPTERLQRGQ